MGIRETIRRILREDTKQEVLDFIDEFGMYRAISFFGGDVLKDILLKDILGNTQLKIEKIDIIKKFLSDIGGITLELAIPYKEDNHGHYHQIEFLGVEKAIINVYGGYKNETDLGEYEVTYSYLPDKSVDDIFEIIMEDMEKWNN